MAHKFKTDALRHAYINRLRQGISRSTHFEARFNTTLDGSPSGQLVLPFTPNADNLIDWGDATINNLATHTYTGSPTDVTVKITGTIDDWRYDDTGDEKKQIELISHGPDFQSPSDSVWQGCTNMAWSVPAKNTPTLTTTNLTSYFEGCSAGVNIDLSRWNVSNITNMVNMFFVGPTPIGINFWDVSNCINFTQMFFGVDDLPSPIGVWNMISATNISGMFRNSGNFNEDVGPWNVENVTHMSHTFAGASTFNKDIGSWDVRKVITMHSMFGDADSFNQYIGDWQLDAILDLSWMFTGNSVFDQDIGGWGVGTCTNFSNMFSGATSFNQYLPWDFSSATNLNTMLDNCGMSTANFDSFLVNLNSQAADLTVGLNLGAQGLTYTSAGAGGTALTALMGAPAFMTFTGVTGV